MTAGPPADRTREARRRVVLTQLQVLERRAAGSGPAARDAAERSARLAQLLADVGADAAGRKP
ncbi:hypothetical protein [Blastococcus sp. URHD0036]|uniref:hypothetical protein n=1 Tax=Blastococcus sp. URHD0036 TaxID=1380356 RepID=UPI000496A1CC|nr:hypothetical protein [Blastococcus sp. URHD0036]